MTSLPELAQATLEEIGAQKWSGKWVCPYCRRSVFQGDLFEERFHCRHCCEQMEAELHTWGFYDLLDRMGRGPERLVQRAVPGVVARRVDTSAEWVVAGRLAAETVSKTEVKEAIEKHHNHHDPPQSAILGVRCLEKTYAGEEVVRGVATLSTPTARMLMEKGTHLEVNRLCSWGPKWRRQNVISRMSGHLRSEARRLREEAQEKLDRASRRRAAPEQAKRRAGIERLRTYILERESGASLRAGGWHLVGRSEGGSWTQSRDGRTRRPRTEGVKWVYDTPL
jgi:hypothetical protein